MRIKKSPDSADDPKSTSPRLLAASSDPTPGGQTPLARTLLNKAPGWLQMLAVSTALTLISGLLLLCFVYPSAAARPGGLQVAITGDAKLIDKIQPKVAAGLGKQTQLVKAPNRAAIVTGIQNRTYAGGIVLNSQAPEVLTASAAGPAIANLGQQLTASVQTNLDATAITGLTANLTNALMNLSAQINAKVNELLQAKTKELLSSPNARTASTKADITSFSHAFDVSFDTTLPNAPAFPKTTQPALPTTAAHKTQPIAHKTQPAARADNDPLPDFGPPPELLDELKNTKLPAVKLTDVVPLTNNDPTGMGLTLSIIPLTIAGLMGGLAISLLATTRFQRLLGATTFSLLGGVFSALLLHSWLGVIPGNFVAVTTALALSLLATTAFHTGLYTLWHKRGLVLAVFTTAFLGLPLTTFGLPAGFLPYGLGTVGQGLIPGATSTLTRNLAYFPAASTAGFWIILLLWALVGCFLTVAKAMPRLPNPLTTTKPIKATNQP